MKTKHILITLVAIFIASFNTVIAQDPGFRIPLPPQPAPEVDPISFGIAKEKDRIAHFHAVSIKAGATAQLDAVEADIGKPFTPDQDDVDLYVEALRGLATSGKVVDHTGKRRNASQPNQADLVRAALTAVVDHLDGKPVSNKDDVILWLILPYGEALVTPADQVQRKEGLLNGADIMKFSILTMAGKLQKPAPRAPQETPPPVVPAATPLKSAPPTAKPCPVPDIAPDNASPPTTKKEEPSGK